jgi:hypothetical protein
MAEAQSGVEYIAVITIALLILMVVVAVVFSITPSAISAAPGVCSFVEPQVSCDSLMAVVNTNTHNTLVVMELTNSGEYALSSMNTYMYIGQWNSSSFACSPSYVKPGSTAICEITLVGNVVGGESLSGYMYTSFNSCGLSTQNTANSCGGVPTKYEGSYKVQVQSSKTQQNLISLSISASSPSVLSNCETDNVSAQLKFNGYPIRSADIAFTSNNLLPKIYSPIAVTNSNGIASTDICSYTVGSSEIVASFGSYNGEYQISFT